jgi:hypothetical protein
LAKKVKKTESMTFANYYQLGAFNGSLSALKRLVVTRSTSPAVLTFSFYY